MSPRETEALRAMGRPKVNMDEWEEWILSEKVAILLQEAAKQLYATH